VGSIILEAFGDFACFTRPEAKVERFSYPVITPSAARGLLDAIYAKPLEFSWRIDKIEILKPIKYIALKRNEVKEVISENSIKRAMRGGDAPLILADNTRELSGSDQVGRTQRQTMALCDVRYRIYAHIHPRPGFEGRMKALEEQAWRRIESGKCFYQPYFGCREFVAFFESASNYKPIQETLDLGYMVYDVFNLDEVVIDNAKPYISVFKGKIVNGILEIPTWDSDLVKKP
jgi:CRISPR-associated protein Cas5d